MLTFLDKIYRFGLTDSLNTYDAFKLQILNRLAVFCIGILLILLTINFSFKNYVGIVIDISAGIFIALPILLLNKRGRYKSATYLFLLGYHVTLLAGTYHSILEERQSGIEYLFIPGVIAIIILVNRVWQLIGVTVNFCLLIFLNYIRFALYGEGEMVDYLRLSLILFAVYLMVCYFVMSFKSRLFRTLNNAEKLNAELIGKEEALLVSNKAKDRLFSIIAHDLRSPLALIQGLLQPDILKTMSKEEYLQYANRMRLKVEKLQDTMNGLLEWSKSQLGSLRVNPETVNVKTEIHSIIDLFSDIMQAKNVRGVLNLDDSLVLADRNQFIIIFRNIIHNAIKFTSKEGYVQVSVFSTEDEIGIAIEDSGVGIDEKMIEKILSGNLIESTYGTAGESGSGIGLSFCIELIKKNHGRLDIGNATQSGTIFTVWLPRAIV